MLKYMLGLITGIMICNWTTVFSYVQKLITEVTQ